MNDLPPEFLYGRRPRNEQERIDFARFNNAIVAHQNRIRRKVRRITKYMVQAIDLHYGYLDLGGEG